MSIITIILKRLSIFNKNKISIILLFPLLVGCAKNAETLKQEEPAEPILQPISSLPYEAQVLLNPKLLQKELKSCKETGGGWKTNYGSWHKLEGCKFTFSKNLPKIEKISIHKSPNGDINAYQFISVNKETLREFQFRYIEGIMENNTQYCARFGENSLPIFKIVKKDLCTALIYKQF
ncbi:hypothetical protein [Prochlorococcus marinus]|uniref:hypothetical protein n=1 Tax=Prochlorococcus marinus TaxID=1219 RepID=UPI0022B5DF5B|nr:hypothetical protein [Prochlorococcus marinus]